MKMNSGEYNKRGDAGDCRDSTQRMFDRLWIHDSRTPPLASLSTFFAVVNKASHIVAHNFLPQSPLPLWNFD